MSEAGSIYRIAHERVAKHNKEQFTSCVDRLHDRILAFAGAGLSSALVSPTALKIECPMMSWRTSQDQEMPYGLVGDERATHRIANGAREQLTMTDMKHLLSAAAPGAKISCRTNGGIVKRDLECLVSWDKPPRENPCWGAIGGVCEND